MTMIIPAIVLIPAGATPAELLQPIAGVPLLLRLLLSAQRAGISEILLLGMPDLAGIREAMLQDSRLLAHLMWLDDQPWSTLIQVMPELEKTWWEGDLWVLPAHGVIDVMLLRAVAQRAVTQPIIAKLLISIAQFIFVSLGGILAMSHLATRPDILWTLVGVVIVAGGFLAGVSRGLQRGLFMQLFRSLDRWRLTPSILERWRTYLCRLDETIAGFYHRHPRHLVLSLLFYILGWLLGGLEVYAIFYAVGRSIDLTEAIAIEALASVAKGLAFFIPGSLGVQEGATSSSWRYSDFPPAWA